MVQRIFDHLGPPGTPFTTPEITAEFDCSDRTIYNRLDGLVEAGVIETKKVGAKGRVWWKPVESEQAGSIGSNGGPERLDSLPVFDSDLIGVIVWDEDVTITDANDAFLEMTGLDYEEALGTPWQDLTPEAFYSASERHIQEVEATGSGVPYEKQYFHADGSRWWGLFESRQLTDSEKVEFVVDITERKQREQLLTVQTELLELIATGASLDESIVGLCAAVGRLGSGVRASVMLADDERDSFQRPIAPELHPSWGDGLEDAPINELMIGTCGEAVFRGEGVTCEDVATDDRWSEEWRELCAANDVCAGHSEPIRDGDSEAVGSLMLCFDEPRTPNEWEHRLMAFATYIAGIAVERQQSREALIQTNSSLERLNDVSRELIDADPEAISECVAKLTVDVLDVEYAALWQYDEQTGTLDVASEHSAPETDLDGIRPSDVSHERVWETFIGDEIGVDDALDVDDDESWPSRLGSRVFVPLGRHGVIVVGSVHVATFDRWRLDLVEMVASTVETAWNRAESERALEGRNEELTRLDRLNTLIRRIDQGLVDAETVEGIDGMVCAQLAASALYEFAWLGEYDADTDNVVPSAWAGVDSVSLEALTAAPDGSPAQASPFATAVRTGQRQVVADIATDARAAPWREAALGLGARSCLVTPVTYDDSIYGVLVVYGSQPQTDERDLDVLSELGRTVGHAIHAVETRQTSRTDSVVELTLQTSAADTPLVRLARELNCGIEFEGLVPGADGETTVFFTVRDVAPDEVAGAAERSLAFEELTQLVERDDGHRFKAQVADESLAAGFLERGATIRSLTIDTGTAAAVVAVPETADVRSFIEGVKRDVPDLDLLARRSPRRTLDTAGQLQTAFEERLTPRQREILQVAYRSGYFESPRVQTGQELSAALDLSQSTFNHHLRGAERRIFDVVFDST